MNAESIRQGEKAPDINLSPIDEEEVEEKTDCENCNGRGKVVANSIYGKEYETCPICEGTGERGSDEVIDPRN